MIQWTLKESTKFERLYKYLMNLATFLSQMKSFTYPSGVYTQNQEKEGKDTFPSIALGFIVYIGYLICTIDK